ncbi:peptidoglycan-recognition protein LA-like isoform X3 [Chrysoperla carnea]|uniref:peptidoglycan-recognition protein LA-like isoform X3 n=1 Tax=Chrysoperla carnea TaxID=189513 RepID=UPI001D0686D2|nr:peptidoglycan-recognition protein LA-like isoform X3 [Chrysoperla carnea]
MVTFMGDSNENENNSTSSIKLQNFQNNNTTIAKSLDTLSVQSDDSISSTDSENLTADGVLISPSRLAVPENGLNIVNSSHVRVGDEVHNNYLGPITVNKQLTIRDLEVNSDQRPHKYAINGNIESDNCDNSLGNINPSFTPENNCDTQIKTAKLDDGLFIITNKNIENCNINTLLGEKNPRSQRKLLIALLLVLICSIIGLIIFFYTKTSGTSSKSPGPIPRPYNNDTDLEKNGIVPHIKWSRQSINDEITDLKLPVKLIIIQHTVTPNCSTYSSCVDICKSILNYHTVTNHYLDIGYNFLIGGDGLIYEGLGFYKEGAHTITYNKKSLGIAFIGNFEKYPATQNQIEAAKNLFKLAVELKVLAEDYRILAASDLTATLSPGKFLIEQLKDIPSWSKIPP